jgi:predicted helicase
MPSRNPGITPGHPLLKEYARSLAEIQAQGYSHELALRPAFQNLLTDAARLYGWTFISEPTVRVGNRTIRPDGLVRDGNNFPRGYWEAKDSKDKLEREIDRKLRNDYPAQNTIFEDTQRAILYQGRQPVLKADLSDTRELSDLLFRFFSHTEPEIRRFEEAVEEFKIRIPQLAHGLADKIKEAHEAQGKFEKAFLEFFELCQRSLNPNIRRDAVDEMLVQHLLTERLFRTIFDNSEFTRRNVIAVELERVIAALVSDSFSRTEYLRSLDPFYLAMESAARTIADFGEKQHFLNSVYERFFQGYSVKVADTHGIVYTPQQIVRFMCAAVESVLKNDFGLALSSPDVNVLDPCTGTGNFVVNILERIADRDLARVYRSQLFANEVMLMPYYIASLNIEHAYHERTGRYDPFDGLCFTDTLDLADVPQMSFFSEKNSERVTRERGAKITVIIGNPPYNMGQLNENDNNKNRRYDEVDKRIRETYSKDSRATLKNKLSDAYVKFFRWATDRLDGNDGVVCFISNNSFVDQYAFDGMRKHLMRDFTHIDHLDLHGNTRKNAKLSGTTHNVFGIQVGVGITIAVRKRGGQKRLRYHRVPEFWRKEEKLAWLSEGKIPWETLAPDPRFTWLPSENAEQFYELTPIEHFFDIHSLGAASNRDEWVYDFDAQSLAEKVKRLIKNYNLEVARFQAEDPPPEDTDGFVNAAPDFMKWTDRLKASLEAGNRLKFNAALIRRCLYRPFSAQHLYFDPLLVHRRYRQHELFPTPESEKENRAIALTNQGSEKPFFPIIVSSLCDLHLVGAGAGSQCFPYYAYSSDGKQKRDAITDSAVADFRKRYKDGGITKWDIFYYIYGVLHHPLYQSSFAGALKRDLPRIPFAPSFRAFSKAGAKLAELHLGYEELEPWALEWVQNASERLSYRVGEKMQLNKTKDALWVNASLTLAGIPSEAFNYRMGSRSPLEWVIDQYHVSEDDLSGIRFDPNRKADQEYVVRLIGQVVRLSVESSKIAASLPPFS